MEPLRQCNHGAVFSCKICNQSIARFLDENVNAVAPMWNTPPASDLETVREVVRKSRQELFSKSEVLALLEGDNADR